MQWIARLFVFYFIITILVFSNPSWGADIWTVDRRPQYDIGNGDIRVRIIGLEGTIERGDYDKIQFLFENNIIVTDIYLYSRGGDVREAMRISELINKNLLSVYAPYKYNSAPDGMRPRNKSNMVCASACALVWISAKSKWGSEVYIHRPRFDHQHFVAMETDEAQELYSKMLMSVRDWLEANNVPPEIISKIESVPSSRSKRLDDRLIDLLDGEDPFVSEIKHAKCQQFDNGKVLTKDKAFEEWLALISRDFWPRSQKELDAYKSKVLKAEQRLQKAKLEARDYYECVHKIRLSTLYNAQQKQ